MRAGRRGVKLGRVAFWLSSNRHGASSIAVINTATATQNLIILPAVET